MRKLLYNILICIAVAAAALIVGLMMRPPAPDIVINEIDASGESKIPEKVETPQTTEVHSPVLTESKVVDKDDAVRRRREMPQNVIKKEEDIVVIEKTAEKKIRPSQQIAEKKAEKAETVRAPPVIKTPEKKELVVQSGVQHKEIPEKPAEKVELAETNEKVSVPEIVYVPGWTEDFAPDYHENGVKKVADWSREGGVMFTPKTRFYLREDKDADGRSILVIEAKKSSAVFAYDLSNKVDLNETPILRWRWRVKKLPPLADGRHRKKDDQAVGIYIGTGNAFNQKSIAYRWETETPAGHWGKTVYSNVMKVHFLSVRNKSDGLDVWYEECRNVRDDFMEKFGFVPEKCALVICGNSQNSKSEALAEIDYIGFFKEVNKKKD